MATERKYVGFHNINTYQVVENETYIGGVNSDGEDGNGVDEHNGMNEPEAEAEWRYECEEIHDGGHL